MEEIIEILYNNNVNLNLILDSSKNYKEYKKQYYTYNLNNEMSLLYYSNIKFRKKIKSLVSYSEQIKLNFCYNRIINLYVLADVHTVNLYYCFGFTDPSPLCYINTLHLYSSNISNVYALKYVRNLYLSWCHEITNVDALGSGGIETLSLYYCHKITNVDALKYIRNLNLSGCHRITNVDALGDGDVETLNLSWCNGITNVDALKYIRNLNLSNCHKITNVDALGDGDVETLNLSWCNGITSVKALKDVRKLDLSDCKNITDADALNIHFLISRSIPMPISRAYDISVSMNINQIHTLNLSLDALLGI
jgi:hypothetical protein